MTRNIVYLKLITYNLDNFVMDHSRNRSVLDSWPSDWLILIYSKSCISNQDL